MKSFNVSLRPSITFSTLEKTNALSFKPVFSLYKSPNTIRLLTGALKLCDAICAKLESCLFLFSKYWFNSSNCNFFFDSNSTRLSNSLLTAVNVLESSFAFFF